MIFKSVARREAGEERGHGGTLVLQDYNSTGAAGMLNGSANDTENGATKNLPPSNNIRETAFTASNAPTNFVKNELLLRTALRKDEDFMKA